MLRTNERIGQALAQSQAIVMVLDEGAITFESDGARALFGDGGTVRDAMIDLVRTKTRGRQGSGSSEMDVTLRDARGEERWLALQATPLEDVDDRPAALLVIGQDVTERHLREADLARKAMTDALTGLPNRLVLADRITQALRIAERQHSSAALIVLDLDRFKDVNDTLGHSAGDLLLREVGQRTRAQLRESDTVARIGGDEFAILLPPPGDLVSALATARKIRTALARPSHSTGAGIGASASLGIALFPEHARTAQALLDRADAAMYAAKRTRSSIALYDPDHDMRSAAVLAQLAEIGNAIEAGRLNLQYQPTIRLADGEPLRAEALVRLMHESRGMLRPAAFLPLAERGGLGPAVSAWVLRHALARCREWRAAGLNAGVSVNVTLRDLLDAELPARITAELAEAELDPSLLTVEISERIIGGDPSRIERALRELAATGIRLALDDFGSANASLTVLQRLPLSEIKLDGRFIGDVCTNAKSWAFVKSGIDAAHDLGLEVTAEGVEDDATAYVLTRLGCDVAQGHYFTAPGRGLAFLRRTELDTAAVN